MQLALKKAMNTGRQTTTKGSLTGIKKSGGQRGTRKTKDTSLISSSQSLTVITPSMFSPPTSSMTDCTAWALLASASPSTDMSYSPLSISPSMKKGSFFTGFLNPFPMTLCTWPCTTTPGPRRTGELQLSSNSTMTCIIKLLPWLQNKGAWPLPLKPPSYSWTKANDACLALMPMSGTNSSTPFMRAPTSTPSPRGSSLPSPTVHATVQLNSNWRVMSQGSLLKGKRTTWNKEWVCLTPKTGRMV